MLCNGFIYSFLYEVESQNLLRASICASFIPDLRNCWMYLSSGHQSYLLLYLKAVSEECLVPSEGIPGNAIHRKWSNTVGFIRIIAILKIITILVNRNFIIIVYEYCVNMMYVFVPIEGEISIHQIILAYLLYTLTSMMQHLLPLGSA